MDRVCAFVFLASLRSGGGVLSCVVCRVFVVVFGGGCGANLGLIDCSNACVRLHSLSKTHLEGGFVVCAFCCIVWIMELVVWFGSSWLCSVKLR